MAGKRKKQGVKKNKARVQGDFLFLNWLLPLSSVFFLVYLTLSFFSNKTGVVGFVLADFFKYYLGNGSFVLILTLLYFSIGYLRWQKLFLKLGQIIGLVLANLAFLPVFSLAFEIKGHDTSLESVFRQAGGFLGSAILHMFLPILGHFGLIILLSFLLFIALCLSTKKLPQFYFNLVFTFFKKLFQSVKKAFSSIAQRQAANKKKKAEVVAEDPIAQVKQEGIVKAEPLPVEPEQPSAEPLDQIDQEKKMTPIKLMAERLAQIGNRKEKKPEPVEPDNLQEEEISVQTEEHEEQIQDLPEIIQPSLEKTELVTGLQADAEIIYGFVQEENGDQDYSAQKDSEESIDIFVTPPLGQIEAFEMPEGEFMETVLPTEKTSRYQKPGLELLQPGKPLEDKHFAELEENTKTLEETLAVFGVKSKVVNISSGPTLTRYELQLAPGIRVNKVANLADDIALSLAATGVRIEAPIPGKPAIGIEVPNKITNIVRLHDVLNTEEFQDAENGVIVPLGKDIAGRTIVADLSKMPHLLIAGATGSGKSVCMNCMITSLLYRFTPDQIKLIMIDPKVVEMSNYNGIPHLLAPVVTDPKKAAGVLKSVTREMDKRYDLFAATGVKNIGQYNEKVLEIGEHDPLSYWVVFIDELADLMIVARDEVEESIIRIAQLARAAGIHLVIGTQRPSSDIITGSIKANIPSRIAFAVSSGVDSRIILDMNGAEKLLGKGDMLFQPMGLSKPVRIQGPLISEAEVERVVEHVKQQGVPVFDEAILNPEEAEIDGEILADVDELFMEAAYIAIETGQGSVSYLQRRLRIGHSRAGRIMDQLEEHGIVGPPQGSKPREVLISKEQLDNKFD